jgi:hypothetical protein
LWLLLPALWLLLLLLLRSIPYLAIAGLGTLLAIRLLLLLPAGLAGHIAAAHSQLVLGCFAGLAVARGL